MSMYRQLWFAIIIAMLLALAGSLVASLLSARAYLEQQLTMKNADNAAALALSMSQQNPDPISAELVVAALFDSGHYASIRIRDPDGRLMVERVAPTGEAGAPEWFVRHVPILAEPGEAQINSGWRQFGTVTLVSHSRFAYEALWQSTKEMIAALGLASFVGGYLGSLILRRLRRPLQAVIDQAQAITDHRFVTIAEPDVPELRQLAAAMNATVATLKTMFDHEAARLEAVRREANFDPLTGLANRDFFIARLRSSLEGEYATGGILFLIHIADLMDINKRLGRETTDDMLRRVAQAIVRNGLPGGGVDADSDEENLAGRMNGADFGLLLTGRNASREVAQPLLQALVSTLAPYVDGGPSVYVGMGVFREGTALGSVLSQVDAAMIEAESEGIDAVREAIIASDDEIPRSSDEWSHSIRQALDRHWLRLASFPVVDLQGRLLHAECPLRLRLDADGEWLPAGRFVPLAERLGLVADLDFATLELGLEELVRQPALKGIAINLSASSFGSPGFLQKVEALLGKQRDAAARLWVEVPEVGALKNLQGFGDLCQLLGKYRCRIGIEHFGLRFSQIGSFHEFGLNYIKVDARFIRRLDTNPGNQTFLRGVSAIAHGIGLLVIAEGVTSDTEFAAVQAVGFDGATGPGVKVVAGETPPPA